MSGGWSILKTHRKGRSARKVHFNLGSGSRGGGCEDPEEEHGHSSSSNSLESDSSSFDDLGQGERFQHVHHHHHHHHHHHQHELPADISHDDVEDEEERLCLRHLDQLGLALENTYREVESIDNYVKKLRSEYDQELVPQQRYVSCMCSARIARAACCKKQIDVWYRLQHDIQETCHHHHPHNSGNANHNHPHNEDDDDNHHHLTEAAEWSFSDSSDSMSTGSSQSHDLSSSSSSADVVMEHVTKMAFFDQIRLRLDPSVDTRTFVENWIMH